jgi:hypothetical protein
MRERFLRSLNNVLEGVRGTGRCFLRLQTTSGNVRKSRGYKANQLFKKTSPRKGIDRSFGRLIIFHHVTESSIHFFLPGIHCVYSKSPRLGGSAPSVIVIALRIPPFSGPGAITR